VIGANWWRAETSSTPVICRARLLAARCVWCTRCSVSWHRLHTWGVHTSPTHMGSTHTCKFLVQDDLHKFLVSSWRCHETPHRAHRVLCAHRAASRRARRV